MLVSKTHLAAVAPAELENLGLSLHRQLGDVRDSLGGSTSI